MMPLWMTATRSPERCGCAFASVTPPCVAQRVCATPSRPASGCRRELGLELRDLADGAAQAELPVALHDGEAGRVVAAVLEPLQALDEDGDDVALCNGADDAAHDVGVLTLRSRANASFGFLLRPLPAGNRDLLRPLERQLAGGASFVIVEPAPIVAPAPISTGATSMVPEPMNALSPITVLCLLAPS